ncbi:MAG: hypothetical protein EOO04_23700 [Chitinophagaceae bacterium]|nr:MAG: hypothetical protein EOO04_23700 [Chitinophagaceae bacterium]
MNKKSLWFITVLMIIALIGVFIMQVYYIRQAYRLNSQIFDQKVYKAMSDVAVQVQKRNARKHIEKKTQEVEEQKESNIRGQTDKIVSFKEAFRQNEDIRRFQQQQTTINYLNFQISKIKENFITPLSISEEEYKEFYNTDKDVVKGLRLIVNQSVDKSGRPILELYPTNLRRLQPFYGSIPDTIRYIAISPEDGSPRFVSLATSDKDLQTKFKIEDANAQQKYQLELNRLYADTTVISRVSQDFLEDVQKEMQLTDLPLSKRISKPVLDALLKKELQNQGINASYKFWLSTAEKDSVIFANYKTEAPIPGNAHSIMLFNNDLNKDPGKLYVSFPNQSAAIYRDMGITLSSSFGFLLLLVFIFAYTIYSIIRQKKISEMKSDFINNAAEWAKVRGEWSVKDSALVQTAEGPQRLAMLPKSFDTCTIRLKARRIGGLNAFMIPFAVKDSNTYLRAHIGSWLNACSVFESVTDGYEVAGLTDQKRLAKPIETGRWYDIRLVIGTDKVDCYLDGELLMTYTPPPKLFALAGRDEKTGDLILKMVNAGSAPIKTTINIDGLPGISEEGVLTSLSASTDQEENSFSRPKQYVPVSTKINIPADNPQVEWPAFSVNVLRIKTNKTKTRQSSR